MPVPGRLRRQVAWPAQPPRVLCSVDQLYPRAEPLGATLKAKAEMGREIASDKEERKKKRDT